MHCFMHLLAQEPQFVSSDLCLLCPREGRERPLLKSWQPYSPVFNRNLHPLAIFLLKICPNGSGHFVCLLKANAHCRPLTPTIVSGTYSQENAQRLLLYQYLKSQNRTSFGGFATLKRIHKYAANETGLCLSQLGAFPVGFLIYPWGKRASYILN